MKRRILVLKKTSIKIYFLISLLSFSSTTFAQEPEELKIDPEMLVLLKESQNITSQFADKLYPGWDFQETPILLYKPNVQELLINFPQKPGGFCTYTGFNPLDDQVIYVRNGTTTIQYDDQNTTIEIEGIKVLVVADTYSSMRNQLRGVMMNQPKEFVNTWLDDRNFVGSPYHKLSTFLHEGFHVYQEQQAPGKNADEGQVAYYPFLNPVNNALSVLEGNILKDALFAKTNNEIKKKVLEFVAVRSYRQSLLDSVFVAYESLNEFAEGTAKYVEFKFFFQGKDIIPIDEMNYINGFFDYKNSLPALFKREIEDMVNIVAVNDNRFGNKFGAGPLRFKLYYLGACQALLLDKVMPEWKGRIFTEGIYLSDLLKANANLSERELKKHLEDAKSAYNYDKVFAEKLSFEKNGKEAIQSKVDAIMKSGKTLIVIDFEGHKMTGMSYTPFGITKVDDHSIIYEMVPVGIYFDEVPELISKIPFPIMVNTADQKIYFSIDTSPDDFTSGTSTTLSVKEFQLVAEEFNIVKKDNRINITFK